MNHWTIYPCTVDNTPALYGGVQTEEGSPIDPIVGPSPTADPWRVACVAARMARRGVPPGRALDAARQLSA